MAGTPQRALPRLSVEVFRGFLEGRPDEEHWELIDGVAVMMAPPTLAHQRIATNLLLLLDAALVEHAPALTVYQRTGVNLGPEVQDYDPEPDVGVIDSELSMTPGLRYADRFYLAAEIVSDSDRAYVDSKREVYKLHATCTCILTIEQDRCLVRIDLRAGDTWETQRLTEADDTLVLADFGLRCAIRDLYRGTALQPRKRR